MAAFNVASHKTFITKYRRDVFNQDMLETLKHVFDETCEQMGAELLESGGEDEHVHLMVASPPKLALANLVGILKEKASYTLRRDYWPRIKQKLWGNHLWSQSYCVVSCGGAPLDIIKAYINNQRQPTPEKSVKISIRETGHKFHKKKLA